MNNQYELVSILLVRKYAVNGPSNMTTKEEGKADPFIATAKGVTCLQLAGEISPPMVTLLQS